MRGLAVVVVAVLAGACGKSSGTPPAEAGGTAGAGARPGGGRAVSGPVPVEVVLVRSDTVIDAITATGQIEPIQSIDLRPEVDGRLVEIAELKDHPFMVGSQFHPEFLSRPMKPHPLFTGFIKAAKEKNGKH